jgi:hypothetical protein
VEEAKCFNVLEKSTYYYSSLNQEPKKVESIYSGVTVLFRESTEESYSYYGMGTRTRIFTNLIGEPLLVCHPKEVVALFI